MNVLVALIDPGHVAHDAAHDWFEMVGRKDRATCPITEDGVIRIVGHPRYPNTPGSPATVAEMMRKVRNQTGHRFWSDDLSLVGSDLIDVGRLQTPAQVTDAYLLALAQAHGGQLATFDRRLSVAAILGGQSALLQIGLR